MMFSFFTCCAQPLDRGVVAVVEKDHTPSDVSTEAVVEYDLHVSEGLFESAEEALVTKAWTARVPDFTGEWETDAGGRYTISPLSGGAGERALRYVEEDLPLAYLTAKLMPNEEFLEAAVTNEVDGQLVGHLRMRREGQGILSWFRAPTPDAEWFCTGIPARRVE